MKTILGIATALLLTGLVGAQAQSDKAKAAPAQTSKMSQVQGKGVPYNKAQPGNTAAKKPDHNIPNPGVQTGPDAKATGQFSPGSHTAQRENKMGRQTKQINPVPKKQ